MNANDPARLTTGGPGFATKTRRVGGQLHGQGLRENLVPVDIRHRHLGRRNHPQVIGRHVVHVFLHLRKLTRTDHRSRIHDKRRRHLGIAMIARVDIEHKIDQGTLQPGTGTGVQREARAGDLCPTVKVDKPQLRRDFPVR